jgi:hypothetical protein
MADGQVNSHAMFSRAMLDQHVMQSTASELLDILKNLSAVDNRLMEQQLRCIHEFNVTPSWSTVAREVIFKMTDKQNILASAPVITIQYFGISYIKKSNDFANILALKKISKNIECGKITGIVDVIFKEFNSKLNTHNRNI